VTRQAGDIVGQQGGAQGELGEGRLHLRYERVVDLGDKIKGVCERHDEGPIGVDSRVLKAHAVDLVDGDQSGARRERGHGQ